MVCIVCLLPLFMLPLVNLLPRLFDFFVGRVHALFGWEYKKPERAPPACPYKSGVKKVDENGEVGEPVRVTKYVTPGDEKQD